MTNWNDGTEEYNLQAKIKKLEGRVAELEGLLSGDPDCTAGPINREAWRQSAIRYADKVEAENAKLITWVNDLQSGMYINCVYCGHRYGPQDDVPTSMADVLKQHIEKCSKHPISALKAALDQVDDVLVVNWITVKDGNYRQALYDLVTWNIQIHDDPSINPDAPRVTKAPEVSPNT